MHSILIIVLLWKISTLSTHHVPHEGFVLTLILLPLPHPPNFPSPTPHTPSIIPLYCFNFHWIVPENINTPSKRAHWLEPPTPNSTHIQFLQWLQTSFKKFGFPISPLPHHPPPASDPEFPKTPQSVGVDIFWTVHYNLQHFLSASPLSINLCQSPRGFINVESIMDIVLAS